MKIALTKISPTHHRFEYTRVDGTGETLELETKTFLFHDLLHFAVESEAKLQNSFYGLLSKSKVYSDLVPKEGESMSDYFRGEVGVTERVVGPLTGVIKGDVTPEDFLSGIQNIFDAYNEPVPAWLTIDFVKNVQEKMRKLLGEWSGTLFGQTMTLIFEM